MDDAHLYQELSDDEASVDRAMSVDGDDGDESDPLASDRDDNADDDHEGLFGASVDTLLAERHTRPKRLRRPLGAPGVKRRASEVPPHLAGVMGSATIAYMSRNFEQAKETLARVIQEAPKAVAPYRTLALICEEEGQHAQALSYLMFAAHLDKQDRELWKRCAALSHELGDKEQAIYCLTMALKGTHGHDVEALQARATIFESLGQHRRAADSYGKLLKLTPGDLRVANAVAGNYRKANALLKAEPFVVSTLEFLEHNPVEMDGRDEQLEHESQLNELTSSLIEIYFSQGRFTDASAQLTRLHDSFATGDMQTPFRQQVMLAVCRYRSGSRALASVTFNEFFGDLDLAKRSPWLMRHVAKACEEASDFAKAARAYTVLLLIGEQSNRREMLLGRALALHAIDQNDAAEEDVRELLRIHPKSTEARNLLTSILGYDERTEGTPVDDDFEEVGNRATRAKGGKSSRQRGGSAGDRESSSRPKRPGRGRAEDGLEAGMRRQAIQEADRIFGRISCHASLLDNPARLLKSIRKYVEIVAELPRGALGRPDRTDTDMLGIEDDPHGTLDVSLSYEKRVGEQLLKHLPCEAVVGIGEEAFARLRADGEDENAVQVVEVLLPIMTGRLQGDDDLRKRIGLLLASARVLHGDTSGALSEVRALARDYPDDDRAWMIMTRLDAYCAYTGDDETRLRLVRFLARHVRGNTSTAVSLMCAAVCSTRGFSATYKSSHATLRRVAQQVPASSLCMLCLGTTMLYIAKSRKVKNRVQAIIVAFGYLNDYRRLRKSEYKDDHKAVQKVIWMETEYNIARALHELGLHHLAVISYHRVLDSELPHGRIGVSVNAKVLPMSVDLKRDAAHNAVRIYKHSGAVALGHAVIGDHLVY